MDASSRWCARASRSPGSYRLSRTRACHCSSVQPRMATCSSNIMSSSRRSSPERHDKVRPATVSSTVLICLCRLLKLSQVSLRRFMGNYIEIKTNYRSICDYCIPPHRILGYCGILVHKLCTRVQETGLLSMPGWIQSVIYSVDIRTAYNSPALHISQHPPHNDNYNK